VPKVMKNFPLLPIILPTVLNGKPSTRGRERGFQHWGTKCGAALSSPSAIEFLSRNRIGNHEFELGSHVLDFENLRRPTAMAQSEGRPLKMCGFSALSVLAVILFASSILRPL
jgi:hypothetical protein